MLNSKPAKRFAVNILVTSALIAIPAVANAVTVPATARPETVQRMQKIEPRPALSTKPLITVEEQETKELKGDIEFKLSAVEFEDGKQLDKTSLLQFYQSKLGKKVTLAELNKIAADITTYYRNNGFILSRAIVPPQRINNGVVKIRIIEGFVSDVLLKGDVGDNDSVLYKYAEKIKQSKPLNAKTLEHYLLLMEDLPGVEARAILQPSPDTLGASQIIVNIKRDMFYGSTVKVDNRGTRFLGPIQATGIFSVNNLFNQDENTSIRVINTPFESDELKYLGFHHEDFIGAEGTRLLFDLNFIETNPGYTLEAFDVEGKNYEASAGLSQPLIRSRKANWFVNSDFSVQRINLDVLNTNLYQDNLRKLTVGSSYDYIDSTNAINRFEGNFSKGFNWFATNNGFAHSRATGKSSFEKFTASATRLQPVYGSWSVSAAVEGQYSLDPLYAAEEYAIGGQRFGSAYDPAEISGDSGIAGRIELQYNSSLNDIYLPSLQTYGFYDIGKVWNRNVLSATETNQLSLASAGIGTRVNIANALTGDLELSVPLTRKVSAYGEDGSAPRVFFSLQYRY